MRSPEVYCKVDNSAVNEYDSEEDHEIEYSIHPACYCLYQFVESQTRISSLLLHAYLYWYLIIMLTFGTKEMTADALLRACLLATFLSLVVTAVYEQLCQVNGPLKVLRLWIIIFSISSVSSVCGNVDCDIFASNYTSYLITQISG
eukprot:225271_1